MCVNKKSRFNIRRTLFLCIAICSIIIVSSSNLYCSNDKEGVISDQDADYLLEGIDFEKGKFSPGSPQNTKQAILAAYMNELNQLNITTNDAVSKIGPIEFSSFTELRDRKNVLLLRNNLKSYSVVKKHHFDLMDELMRKYRNRLGYGNEKAKRLEGSTLNQLFEKLEEIFIIDLDNFYDFVLQHHEIIKFTEGQIYLEDEELVDDLNTLWNKAVKSASDFANAQDMSSKTITQSVEKYKKERNLK